MEKSHDKNMANEFVKDIEVSWKAYKKGKFITHEELIKNKKYSEVK